MLKLLYILLLVDLYFIYVSAAQLDFTSIICRSKDPDYSRFEYCYLKAVNRTYKYYSLRANLFYLPVSNATVRIAVVKRANGYKPFLYDITFDACKFLIERRNPLLNFFYSFIVENSNLNHTCPYDHDVILEKWSIQKFSSVIKTLPMPAGEYGVKTYWYSYNVFRATVDAYFTIKE